VSDNDLEKLLFNLELMGDQLRNKKASFDALSDSEQDEICRRSHEFRRAVISQFQDFDKNEIKNAYCQALLKENPSRTSPQDEAELFISSLEDWGVYATEIRFREREAQERRKEKSDSFLKSVARLLETMNAMDDASLGFLLSAGFEQLESERPDESIPIAIKGNRVAFMAFANELKSQHLNILVTMHSGMAAALKNLPRIDKDSDSPEFVTAAAIEDYLGRSGIPFSTTDTGLAGKAFYAVMTMAGIERDKAWYWLDKARKHENSWFNFAAKMKAASPT